MRISTSLLTQILIVEALALALGLLLVFGHGLWLWWSSRRTRRRLAPARNALVLALEDRELPPEERQLIRNLPVRLQIRLFTELAPILRGARQQQLAELSRELGILDRAERGCRSRLWWRRLHGCRLLTLLGGGESSAPALFKDPHPLVRVQAAEWAADHPEPAIIDSLLALLADQTILCRFTVQDSLLRMGRVAVEPIILYLDTHAGTEIVAALEVAVALSDPRFLEPALSLCHDATPPVRALAATLVGALGGGASVEILLELLHDGDAEVRAAAARAVGKLGYWQASATLVTLLRDRAWIVRREAGLALRALGAPGLLYLRRALGDADRFAADMARQVLDLPGGAAVEAAS